MSKWFNRSLLLLSALSMILTGAAAPASPMPWQSKIDSWVLQTAAVGETEFLLYMTSQADLSAAAELPTRLEKGRYVYNALTSIAARTQKPIIAELQTLGVEYRSYWIANLLWVRGTAQAVRLLAERPDVAHLYANPQIVLDAPMVGSVSNTLPASVEWNIARVNAPAVWALGYTGQGVVVGGQDTGYIWDHPALKNHYRGWNGSTVDHNYNWYDATSVHSPTPLDPFGHGTPTMGAIVGSDGAANQIGMAPGARWIGCRNMDAKGVGSPETYTACYQWFVAPTRPDGTLPQPDLAPDVINNSWSCQAEGCNPISLLAPVQNLVAAGIVTVHSAGNLWGEACSTIDTPAAIYAESFTVGATDSSDTIAGFSRRGPVTVDGSNRLKPDITAPGVDIRTSTTDGGYALMTGTSMATPHVTGLVALLISAHPGLRGRVDSIKYVIEQSALHIHWVGCSSSGVPNNAYGWGRIDALAAYSSAHLLSLAKQASHHWVNPGDTITYSLTVNHSLGVNQVANVTLTDAIPAGAVFVSATAPYTLSGNTIRWSFPAIQPSTGVSVNLVVQANALTGAIINGNYSVQSDQTLPVNGSPVVTFIGKPNLLLLPLALRNP